MMRNSTLFQHVFLRKFTFAVLLILFACHLNAQYTIAKWYNDDFSPTVLFSQVTSGKIISAGDVSLTDVNQNNGNVFYDTGGWPTSQWNQTPEQTFNPDRFIQFKLSAGADYKVVLKAFEFNGKANSADGQKLKVRFSKNASFSNPSDLLSSATTSSKYDSYNLEFPPGTVINQNETIYVRVYLYNTNQHFHIQHDTSGSTGPKFIGQVLLMSPVKPKAIDDRVGIVKNSSVNIDVLGNDEYFFSGALQAISIESPAQNGTVVVNGVTDIKYTPNKDFVGYDSFNYTLTNAVGQSNIAKVTVQVVAPVNGTGNPIVRWNKVDFSATNYTPHVSGANIFKANASQKLTVESDNGNGLRFNYVDNHPSPQQFDGNEDVSKYLQFSVSSNTPEYIAYLNSFAFRHRSTGTGNITIKYSKTPDFTGAIGILAQNEKYTGNWSDVTASFPPGTSLYPGEKLYIRIYVYNTNQSSYYIKVAENGEVGPSIIGTVAKMAPEPCTVGVASISPAVCINTVLPVITHITSGASGIGQPTGLPTGVSATWTANTITISGTPTVAGTFNYSIPLTGACASLAATGQIIVRALPETPVIAVTQPTCSAPGTAKISNYIATNTYTFMPSGPTVAAGGVISGLIPNTSYRVSTTGLSCISEPSAVFSVGVQLPTVAVSVNISSNLTSAYCAGTEVTFSANSVNAGAAPVYEWRINGNPVAGQNLPTFTTSTLKDGDQVSVTLIPGAQPCISPEPAVSNVITMRGEASVYENGLWSKGIPTKENQLSAEIRSAYSTAKGALNACSVYLTANAQVIVVPQHPLTVYNSINLDEGSGLTVQNDANLVQVNDAAPANKGNIAVLRDIKLSKGRAEYNYLGTPVAFAAGETYKTIYPGISYALYYNENNNYFYASSGVNIPGRGLAVKEPTVAAVPAINDKVTATYTGVPQNGVISFPLANSNTGTNTSLGYNLVGNPYPSNIDLVKLYSLNGGSKSNSPISATFYLWDSTVNTVYTQQGSSYSGQAYAIFNAAAGSKGTGTSAAGYLAGNVTGKKTPTQVVTVGQGFLVKSLTKNGVLQFTNAIRTDGDASPGFLGKSVSEKEDDRYWLTMTTPAQLNSSMAVVYFDGGNRGFGVEDSESRGGSDELFSMVDGTKAAINGKSIFNSNDTVPLGSKHFVDGVYTISLEKAEGVFANGQAVYLKDKNTGIMTDLTKGSYSFTAAAGEATGRFEIKYQADAVLSADTAAKEEIVVYRDKDDFVVKASSKKITGLEVYDSSGRLVSKSAPGSGSAVISSSVLHQGMYVLKIDQNGKTTIKKIIK